MVRHLQWSLRVLCKADLEFLSFFFFFKPSTLVLAYSVLNTIDSGYSQFNLGVKLWVRPYKKSFTYLINFSCVISQTFGIFQENLSQLSEFSFEIVFHVLLNDPSVFSRTLHTS